MEAKVIQAVNWNTPENDYALMFWEQNLKQFWIDTEYVPSRDIDSWRSLSPEMREAYKKVLGGLTLLDTLQSHVGMPSLIGLVEGTQNRSVLTFMCAMESIHAKSYSTIFSTVATQDEIEKVFEFVKHNQNLQYKARLIEKYYNNAGNSPKDLWLALASSVLLESFLFYSGFFLPLWLAGHGSMTGSADIIKKIVEDESIHGVFVGLLAQNVYEQLSVTDRTAARSEFESAFKKLMENEYYYTTEVYAEVGLSQEVKEYLKYNANKAYQNLGFDEVYKDVKVNSIVLNGISTATTQHDFFSKKSTNYEKATEVTPLTDEDYTNILGNA